MLFCTNNRVLILEYSRPAFICSKLTIETLEQGVKYVKVNNKDTSIFIVNFDIFDALFYCFYC